MARTPLRVVTLVLALFLALVAAPAAAQAQSPLVGEWHMDEDLPVTGLPESDRYTPDSSGLGRHLTWCNGCAQLANEGAFSNYVSESSNLTSLTTGPGANHARVTLIAWARAAASEGNSRVIAGRGLDSVTCEEMPYALNQEGGDGGGAASFSIRRPDGSSVLSPTFSTFTDSAWHMLAGVFDGSTVRLYVDGNQVGSGTPAGTAAIGYGSSSRFGVDGFGGTGCPFADFTGGIDEVREYNRALSATEIGRLAADATPLGGNPPVLVPDPTPPNPPRPPNPPPTARFTLPGQILRGQPAILNASASRNASQFLWDVNSDGTTDIRTDKPVVMLRLPKPSVLKVNLTTISSTGQTANTSNILRVTGPQPPKGLPSGALPTPVAATSLNVSLFQTQTGAGCANSEVIFDLIEAKGCFERVSDVKDVPAAERQVVQQHYGSEVFNKVIAVLCARAARGEIPQSKCDNAKANYTPGLDVYISKGPVRLNGVTISPKLGRSVVVYPKTERVISSFATVSWGGLPLTIPRKVDFNLGSGAIKSSGRAPGSPAPTGPKPFPSGRAQLLFFDGRKSLPDIGGFPVNGQADLAVEARDGRRFSAGTIAYTLPPVFKAFGDKPPSTRVKLTADNRGGPVVDDLDAIVPEANVGPIRLTNLSFKYRRDGRIDGDFNPGTTCSRKEWKVRADVFLTSSTGGGLKMTPPPPQNGLGFCAGNFKHFGMDFFFPKPKPQIFPGVNLSSIGFGVQLNPVVVRGRGGFDVGDVTTVDGELLFAFATPRQPYVMGPGEPETFNALRGRRFESTTVAVGGAVRMKVPAFGQLRLANAALMYSAPDFAAFGGGLRVVVPGMSIDGGVAGWLQAKRRRFQMGGFVNACIAGLPVACEGAVANVGSKGLSACINIGGQRRADGTAKGGINIGAGYRWGEAWPTIWPFDGCKHSPFWEVETARASADRRTFTIARGEARKFVKVRGVGGAPIIEVRAPGGEVLSTAGKEFAQSRTMTAIRQNGGRVTWLGVKGGRPGRYTITTLPGSVPLGRMAASRPGYDTEFKARVIGRGAVRTLVYDARKPGGQRVTFIELGNHVARTLRTVRGGKGKFRFRPTVAAGRRRSIVAVSTLNGTPLPDKTLARFRAPAIPRTGRPKRVSVRRRGTRLAVRWSKARGAKRYGVVLRLGNGQTRMFRVSARRRSLRIRGVSRTLGGSVSVSAQGLLNDWGRARSRRFKRLAVPVTVVQTDRSNEKLVAKRDDAKKRKAAKRKKAKRKRSSRRKR